jgi:hypothetical protein
MAVLGDGQLDAAFVGLGRLAQQRDQRGLTDRVGQPVHQPLGQFELVGGELQRAEFAERARQFGAVADHDHLGIGITDPRTVHHQHPVPNSGN